MSRYTAIAVDQIPVDTKGCCTVDLYIHLPTAKKYLRFLVKGESLSSKKIEALKKQKHEHVYTTEGEAVNAVPSEENASAQPHEHAEFLGKMEVLGNETEQRLRDVYREIFDAETKDPKAILTKVEALSDEIVLAVAPEVRGLRDVLLKSTHHIDLLNDVAAISSFAILFAFANGFTSQRCYRDLCTACVIMDLALMEFSEEDRKTFLLLPEKLDLKKLVQMRNHPARSYEIAQQKLKNISEDTMELIQNHHELHNGKGYPRGIRTDTLLPLVRTLSLAVEVFDRLKAASLRGESLSMPQLFAVLIADTGTASDRDHSPDLLQTIMGFMDIPAAA